MRVRCGGVPLYYFIIFHLREKLTVALLLFCRFYSSFHSPFNSTAFYWRYRQENLSIHKNLSSLRSSLHSKKSGFLIYIQTNEFASHWLKISSKVSFLNTFVLYLSGDCRACVFISVWNVYRQLEKWTRWGACDIHWFYFWCTVLIASGKGDWVLVWSVTLRFFVISFTSFH